MKKEGYASTSGGEQEEELNDLDPAGRVADTAEQSLMVLGGVAVLCTRTMAYLELGLRGLRGRLGPEAGAT